MFVIYNSNLNTIKSYFLDEEIVNIVNYQNFIEIIKNLLTYRDFVNIILINGHTGGSKLKNGRYRNISFKK